MQHDLGRAAPVDFRAVVGQPVPSSSGHDAACISLAQRVIWTLAARRKSDGRSSPRSIPTDLDALCHALISDDAEAAARMIRRLRKAGASLASLHLHHLAPAARQLGAWWDEDRISFPMVTIGTARIQTILLELAQGEAAAPCRRPRCAVFATVPGEVHTLGVRMAADLFRSRGWHIDLKLGLDQRELLASLAACDAPVIGLSASGPKSLDALVRLVAALREAKPGLRILVSGQIASAGIDLCAVTGADAVATDFDTVAAELDRLAGVQSASILAA